MFAVPSYPYALVIINKLYAEIHKTSLNSLARFSPLVSLALTEPRNSSQSMTLPPVHSTNLTHTKTCSCVETPVPSSPI
jgi:hypothetical protein